MAMRNYSEVKANATSRAQSPQICFPSSYTEYDMNMPALQPLPQAHKISEK